MPEALGLGKIEPVLGARERNERKATLLLHGLNCTSFARRQHAFGQRANENMAEFQTLCSVDGHETHVILRSIYDIGIGKQGYVMQIMVERDLLAARCLEFVHRLFQLGKVIEPLLASLGAQHLLVAAFVEQRRKHFGYRATLSGPAKTMHKRYKLLRLRTFEDVILARCLEGLQHGAAVFITILLQICHATLTEVALRHVRHAQKRQVVPDRDKAQVAQRVLDLASSEKGHAAEQRIRDIRLQKRLFDRTGCVVRAIHHRDIAIGNPLAMHAATPSAIQAASA